MTQRMVRKASPIATAATAAPSERRRPSIVWVVFSRPVALTAASVIAAFVLLAVSAPLLAPSRTGRDPYLIPTVGFEMAPHPPSVGHPFGTTEDQFDLYYGIVWGTRTVFKVTLTVIGASVLIGLVLGSVAGYCGGLVDEAVMRFTDIFLAFPGLVLAVVIVALLGKGLDKVVLAIAAVNWPTYARLMRGETLTVKGEEFVTAARTMGASDLRIILRHIVPNAFFPFFVYGSLDMGNVVITSAALSFLGLGTEIGYADWGQLIALSRRWILGSPGHAFQFWYTIIYPAAAITLFVLAWNILGDAIRDVLDPRMRGSREAKGGGKHV
jgi:peptide/nickel transport system permease protein